MADTVLLIHGYGCAGDVWGPVAARLKAEGYSVVAPTIRSAVRTVEDRARDWPGWASPTTSPR